MRSTAQIGKRALSVSGYCAVLKFVYQLAFIYFSPVAKHCKGIGFRDVFAHNRIFHPCELKHLFLYLGKVCCGYCMLTRVYVIIESIFHCRANTEFHSGI